MVSRRWSWRHEWVCFHNGDGQLTSVPIDWTSLSAHDPFVVVSNGRARFRTYDLLRLAELIDAIKAADKKQNSEKSPKREV